MAVHVHVSDDAVTIDLAGWDAVWALKRQVVLSHRDIVSARVAPVRELVPDVGLRVGGTWLPRRAMAGHYTWRHRKGKRQLWCVYRDPEVLVIDTVLDNPARVVLQHPDRNNLAWYIGERVGAS